MVREGPYASCNVNCTCSTSRPARGYGTARSQLAPLGPNLRVETERLTQLTLYIQRQGDPAAANAQNTIPPASPTTLSNPIILGSPSFPRPPHQPRQRRRPHTLRIRRWDRHSTIQHGMPVGYFPVDGRCRKPSATPDSRDSQPERQINEQLSSDSAYHQHTQPGSSTVPVLSSGKNAAVSHASHTSSQDS
jgi:hypothetical protein